MSIPEENLADDFKHLPHRIIDEQQDIMSMGNKKTTFTDDMISKDRIKQLVAKFPSYPCLAERHPENVEQFIASYNAVLAEVKSALS